MAEPQFQIALTTEQFNALVAKFVGPGKTFSDTGTLPETQGVQLGYSVNRASDVSIVVTFTVLKKPWYATTGMIQSYVQQMIGA